MSDFAIRFRLLLVALLLGVGASGAGQRDTWSHRIIDALHEARAERGAGPLERRDALDRAARRRAQRIADLPEDRRLSLGVSIDETLREAGVVGYHRARSHLDLQTGFDDPAGAVVQRWRGSRSEWKEVTSPDMDAIGMAMVRARDGWLVTVAILVEDQELSAADTRAPFDPSELERVVVTAVNREREAQGLAPLVPEPRLVRTARSHSRDMAVRGYFAHESPEGRDMAWRAGRAGIEYRRLAENIAYNHHAKRPAAEAVAGWMRSPGHRANILNPVFTHTGVGVVADRDGVLYFTQLFLLPPE